MGVANSKKPHLNGETDDTLNIGPVTPKDIELIRASWCLLEHKEDFAIGIMVRIFQEHKEIKNKWIFATNLETEAEMISNSQVRYHAKKILDIMTKIINKLLSNPNEFSIEDFDLTRLGRNHFHYGVIRDHFYVFEESLIYSLRKQITSNEKHEFTTKMEKAWHKIFWIMVNKMAEGIVLEEQENICLNKTESNE